MRLSFEWGAGDILRRIQALRRIVNDIAGVFPPDPDNPEHKKLIATIDDTIRELEELKTDLEGKRGFWRTESTEYGDVERANRDIEIPNL